VENARNWRMGWISFWTGPKIKQTGLNRFRTGPSRPCKKKEKKTGSDHHMRSTWFSNPPPLLPRVFYPQTQTPELETLTSPSSFPHHPHLLVSLYLASLSLPPHHHRCPPPSRFTLTVPAHHLGNTIFAIHDTPKSMVENWSKALGSVYMGARRRHWRS